MTPVADDLGMITMAHRRVRCNASGGLFCLIVCKPDGNIEVKNGVACPCIGCIYGIQDLLQSKQLEWKGEIGGR